MFGFLSSRAEPGPEKQPGSARNVRRLGSLRKLNQSFLRIREISEEDADDVRKLLFDHFRSLTFPAIVYWVVQHAHDLVAIMLIVAFLLPIKNMLYFCGCFLVYLYIRARYEIEKHIRYCCPDLDAVFETYRTTRGSNFWVGYFSNHDEQDLASDAATDSASNAPDTKSAEASDDNAEDKDAASVASGTNDSDRQPPTPEGEGSSARQEGSAYRRQHTGSRHGFGAQGQKAPLKLQDVLNRTKCKENEILGCIGITPYRNNSTIAQMVRLVVSKKCRNMKVGSKLLSHLEAYAVDFGYTEIRVYTNNLNTAYLQFLKQNGFVIQQIVRRGLMRGDLIIWNKVLSQPKDLLIAEMQTLKKLDASFIPE